MSTMTENTFQNADMITRVISDFAYATNYHIDFIIDVVAMNKCYFEAVIINFNTIVANPETLGYLMPIIREKIDNWNTVVPEMCADEIAKFPEAAKEINMLVKKTQKVASRVEKLLMTISA